MKQLFLVLLFYLFSQVISLANERDARLNQLFNELKANNSKVAFIIEQEIWALWSTHPTNEKLTARLEEGSQFVRDQKYMKAKDYIKQINDLPESEWDRMKEHMDKKFPNMKMPNMDTFKEMVKLFGMSMEKSEREEDDEKTNNRSH